MENKLMIVSYSFPPDNVPAAQRPYFMHKYLQENGVKSLVLTTSTARSSLGKSEWGAEINGVFTTGDNGNNKNEQRNGFFSNDLIYRIIDQFKIPDKALPWLFPAIKKASSIIRNDGSIDCLYSTSPSVVNHLVCWYLSKKFKLKWIADFRDFYFIETIENKSYLFRKPIDKWIETKVLKRADVITFISKMMRDEYVMRYDFVESKSEVIYNGYDPHEYTDLASPELPSDKLSIFYAGSFYRGQRSPLPLLHTLDELEQAGNVDLRKVQINIAGRIEEDLWDKIRSYRSGTCINFLGLIPRKQVLSNLTKNHLLWLIVANEKSHYYGFPVKGFEYIAAKRPILAFTPNPSEPQRIIEELHAGKVLRNSLTTEDTEINKEILLTYYRQFLDGELSQPTRIAKEKVRRYQREEQAADLARIVKELN